MVQFFLQAFTSSMAGVFLFSRLSTPFTLGAFFQFCAVRATHISGYGLCEGQDKDWTKD